MPESPTDRTTSRAAVRVNAGFAGDTPILMADGRLKRLGEIRSADRVYGSHMAGRYRRYLLTHVVEHRRRVGRAFLVTLEDGTRLTVGIDQRLLSERGWKHVTGAERGSLRRPHLTVNNGLMGIGRFASPPEIDEDYRRGYLCGMIRGDGQLGHYPPGAPAGPMPWCIAFALHWQTARRWSEAAATSPLSESPLASSSSRRRRKHGGRCTPYALRAPRRSGLSRSSSGGRRRRRQKDGGKVSWPVSSMQRGPAARAS